VDRQSLRIAYTTYVMPLTTARALRIVLIALPAFVAIVLFLFLLGKVFPRVGDVLPGLRRLVIMPGVPLAAILLAELPLRDGIANRTLLYPLLGPTSRMTLAVVRTAVTAVVLAALSVFLVVLVGLLSGTSATRLWEEVLAVCLGSTAYISIFGLIHLVSRRGLLAGLAVFALLDEPLGRIPFALRNLAPSRHVRVLSGHESLIKLPVMVGHQSSSETASALLLVALALAGAALTAVLFNRKNLGELC
jgi:hypothetical protein